MQFERIKIDLTIPNVEARARNKRDIETLAASMNEVGLLNPITVVRHELHTNGNRREGFKVLAGSHRFEAAKMLGWSEIDSIVLDYSQDDYRSHRLVEIAENLHRAELTALERSKMIEEWVELVGDQSAQVALKGPVGHRPKSGVNDAARQLGIERTDVQRAIKVASLSPEAQDAAREVGLDDNRSALLEARKQPTPEAQVESLRQHAERKMKFAPPPLDDFEAREAWVESGMKWWNRGSAEWRKEFLERIGER